MVEPVEGITSIKAGKYYLTRDGQKAFVAAKVLNPENWLNGEFYGDIDGTEETAVLARWSKTGESVSRTSQDLVAEWVEPKRVKGWLNIYYQDNDGDWRTGCLYSKRETADSVGQGRTACIEIDVLEGQGL